MSDQGYQLSNADLTIVAQQPKDVPTPGFHDC